MVPPGNDVVEINNAGAMVMVRGFEIAAPATS
jgi:hypothetical protein